MFPFIFQGLGKSVRGADAGVMLHFTQGLGTDAQLLGFWFFTSGIGFSLCHQKPSLRLFSPSGEFENDFNYCVVRNVG